MAMFELKRKTKSGGGSLLRKGGVTTVSSDILRRIRISGSMPWELCHSPIGGMSTRSLGFCNSTTHQSSKSNRDQLITSTKHPTPSLLPITPLNPAQSLCFSLASVSFIPNNSSRLIPRSSAEITSPPYGFPQSLSGSKLLNITANSSPNSFPQTSSYCSCPTCTKVTRRPVTSLQA